MSTWIENIFSKRSTDIRPGLERVKDAMEWWKPGEHKNILVAGTNGKGTVVSNLWKMLQKEFRVGVFTSPHLQCFSERFEVSGDSIKLSDVHETWVELKESLPSKIYDELSFFEVSTLIGIGLFKKKNCDIVIWEVGLGGRLDATNALEPDISVVASIALDHQEWLGDNIQDIAREKIGVARRGKPLVWGERSEELIPILESERLARGFQAIFPKETQKNIELSSHPLHLQRGFDIAVEVLNQLGVEYSPEEFEAAPIAKFYRGRCERLSKNGKTMWVDVCHNPAAAHEFSKWLSQNTKKIPILYSVLDDKDEAGILLEMRSSASVLRPFRSRSDRCNRSGYKENFSDQIKWVENNGVDEFAVCGSFQAVTEALAWFDEMS